MFSPNWLAYCDLFFSAESGYQPPGGFSKATRSHWSAVSASGTSPSDQPTAVLSSHSFMDLGCEGGGRGGPQKPRPSERWDNRAGPRAPLAHRAGGRREGTDRAVL